MSGHSKWHSIKHHKGLADTKRAAIFTKLGRAITVAAKEGGADPTTNFRLRLATDSAKRANMPKDNIERAIKRGTGELKDANQIGEIVYEGYGPNAIAFIIETLTDNKNRTVSDLKHIFSKHGGNLGGSVMWMFDRKGVIRVLKNAFEENKPSDELELLLIDAGLSDIHEADDMLVFITEMDALQSVEKILLDQGIGSESSGLEYLPKEYRSIDSSTRDQLEKLFEALEDNEDVNEFYTNVQY